MNLIQSKLKNSQGRTVSPFPYIAFTSAGVITLNHLAVRLLCGNTDADAVYIDFFYDERRVQDRYIGLGSENSEYSVRFRAKRGKDGRINRYTHMNKEYSKQLAEDLGVFLPMRFRIATQPSDGAVYAIITSQNLKVK